MESADILRSYCSDHCAIELTLDFSKFKRGEGFWKFNKSLLCDSAYVKLVKECINKVVAQYGIINGDDNFYVNASTTQLEDFYQSCSPASLQHVNLKINPQVFLDVLLLEIRGTSIKYSSKIKRERNLKEQELMHDIEMLESEVAAVSDNVRFDE